ncbi:uncharacterized protein MELLADRAFT_111418 [Melampsora larici-populina 98AG31]|uniref:Uncharacterized protein n=1 Tax=Melampsora larici-populina (strain 98AG31 / pathotype 3-4-7) TaxID=747676 RepID=F4S351_MELLP|nr:uncharacterized protein MELLADRAFT_111418 [Melampsora larici-populina 98AG31]EGG00970.1 hypothetical protein MELLADRAFT_111418 [Melampsora larici-populina 98AG31]
MAAPQGQKKLSKLQMRIQAGQSSTLNKLSTTPSIPSTTNESNPNPNVNLPNSSARIETPEPLLFEPFSFPTTTTTTTTSLYLSPSDFSNTLPPFEPPLNSLRCFMIASSQRFYQPVRSDAFLNSSPDDRVMNSRKGTALGVTH